MVLALEQTLQTRCTKSGGRDECQGCPSRERKVVTSIGIKYTVSHSVDQESVKLWDVIVLEDCRGGILYQVPALSKDRDGRNNGNQFTKYNRA